MTYIGVRIAVQSEEEYLTPYQVLRKKILLNRSQSLQTSNASVALMVERRFEEPSVGSSTLSRSTRMCIWWNWKTRQAKNLLLRRGSSTLSMHTTQRASSPCQNPMAAVFKSPEHKQKKEGSKMYTSGYI